MAKKTTSVKSIVEKFNIDDVELSHFFLMQEYRGNFTKCKKIKDAINLMHLLKRKESIMIFIKKSNLMII